MQSNFLLMLLSILLTAVCWGTYGPVLHWGQHDMGGGRLRTFICVGIAYFLVAIVVPVAFMAVTGGEMEKKYHATPAGVWWSLFGGALGAVGALGIIMAFNYSPFKALSPIVVMPLVFGLAPVINVAFTMYMNRGKGLEAISPFFAAGLILTAVGAATVLVFAPRVSKKDDHSKKPAMPAVSAPSQTAGLSLDTIVGRTKELETLLEDKLGATGRGLHEKATAVEDQLDPDMLSALRFIATIRNKALHDQEPIDNQAELDFLKRCDEVQNYLNAMTTENA